MGLLRFWLAIAVVFEHSALFLGDPGRFPHHLRLLNGQTAVQCFYLISGFYISLILNEKYVGRGSGFLFITNRFLRIYPVYWIMLLLTVACEWTWFKQCWSANGPGSGAVQLASNVALYGLDWQYLLAPIRATGQWVLTTSSMYDPRHLAPWFVLPQAWTLGVELTFYAVAIWLVRRRPGAVVGIILASLALRVFVAMHFGLTQTPWNYRFFPFEIALFLAGNLAYRLFRSPYVARFGETRWPGIAFLILTGLYGMLPEFGAKRWLFYATAVLALPLLFARSKKRGWDFYVGELSYPIYISHMLVVDLLKPHVTHLRPGRAALLVLALTLALSCALLHWVQEPIERIRAARARRAKGTADAPLEAAVLPAADGSSSA